MTKRPEKKSETIEVRVSYSEKLAFMEACKQAGTTASHAIRGYIDDFLHPEQSADTRALSPYRLFLMGLAGLALIIGVISVVMVGQRQAGAIETVGRQVPTAHRAMGYFDKNHDGFVDGDDVAALSGPNGEAIAQLIKLGDKNADQKLDGGEFAAMAKFTIEMPSSANQEFADGERKEKVLVFPPGLNEKERREYLIEMGANKFLSDADIERLSKIVDVLDAEDTNSSSPNN
ncbi:hypothetical protein [Kordiimonas sp. SCSIO 12610]|uniref:hypothetical protein n=1 Tax=Kordiimonas sp. SCSIO 12610 TaxID=2829597 RepID=UPI00210E6CEF|nr:hypothetical protein [Kordiimonas sp. SCSIO 12610]UTW56288.1 hypothetical protein KFF44_05140 [Kordiimonas sp. SCSIO 12610]